MSKIKTVLSATDFSDDARYATQRAGMLAAALGARLEVLHVVSAMSLGTLRQAFGLPAADEAKLIDDAQHALKAQVAEVAATAGAEPTARVAVGDVQETILSAADQADLLVLGAHGSNRLRDMLVGTTSERLLGRNRRPVLVVKRPPAGPYQRVLIPLDFAAYSTAALRVAMCVAPQAELLVVHAFDVPYQDKLWLAGVSQERIEEYQARERQQAQERIAALVRDSAADARRLRGIVEQDDPAPLVLSKESEFDADLIVMGKRNRARAGEMLLGSVTRRVLSAAKCDVLVVHD